MSQPTFFRRFKNFLKPILGPRVIRWIALTLEFAQARAKQANSAAQLPMLVWQMLGVRGQPYRGLLQRHVVMLVVSDIRVDPRVQKAAKAAVDAGFRVTVVCPRLPVMDVSGWTTPDWGPGVEFEFPHPGYTTFIALGFPWLVNRRMYAFCKRYRNVIFHCHDLNTALMGLHLARATDSVSISDFHEWFSENVSWSVSKDAFVPHGRFKHMAMRRAEFLCQRHAERTITVCESIAKEMEALVPGARPFTIVRNIPEMSPAPQHAVQPLKEQLGLPASTRLTILWQGGVGPSRLLEPVIEALRLAQGVHLVIRGPGLEPGAYFTKYYADYARRFGVEERVTLLPPVPSREVVSAARGADAGLWTLPNLGKNFYYALPNKLFEYLAAGLPVLVAHFPEARALAEGYQVGLAFDPYSPESIAEAMARLRDDPALARAMRVNTQKALLEMDAASEWAQVGAMYEELVAERLAVTAHPAAAAAG